jgi:hypothetical protein
MQGTDGEAVAWNNLAVVTLQAAPQNLKEITKAINLSTRAVDVMQVLAIGDGGPIEWSPRTVDWLHQQALKQFKSLRFTFTQSRRG